MRKKIARILAMLMAITAFAGCSSTAPITDEDSAAPVRSFRFEECGLAYELPETWFTQKNVNLIPVSYVEPSSEIYAKIEYDFVPDENMAELDNPESEIPIEELMVPLFTLLVVKEENMTAPAVLNEMDLYQNAVTLPAQEGFAFYYLTGFIGNDVRLSDASMKTYESLIAALPQLEASIETFAPDESITAEKLAENKKYLNFMSTTLTGEDITSAVFYDYDMTVVNFWASYCYPDINELATLQAFQQALAEKHPNVNFLQVVIDTPDANAEAIVTQAYTEAGVTFIGIKPDQYMASWIIENINGLPTTIFVDNTGKTLSKRIEGVQDETYYMEVTESMLSELIQ